jgi:hypothetical protein
VRCWAIIGFAEGVIVRLIAVADVIQYGRAGVIEQNISIDDFDPDFQRCPLGCWYHICNLEYDDLTL